MSALIGKRIQFEEEIQSQKIDLKRKIGKNQSIENLQDIYKRNQQIIVQQLVNQFPQFKEEEITLLLEEIDCNINIAADLLKQRLKDEQIRQSNGSDFQRPLLKKKIIYSEQFEAYINQTAQLIIQSLQRSQSLYEADNILSAEINNFEALVDQQMKKDVDDLSNDHESLKRSLKQLALKIEGLEQQNHRENEQIENELNLRKEEIQRYKQGNKTLRLLINQSRNQQVEDFYEQ